MSQVILFDLDGTLTESGEGIINCVQYALEKLGKKEEHPENLQCFIGPPLKRTVYEIMQVSARKREKRQLYITGNGILQREYLKTVCIRRSGNYWNF